MANRSVIALLATGTLFVLLCGGERLAWAQQVPSDVNVDFCSLPDTEFASWFENGVSTLNGAVKPGVVKPLKAQESTCQFHRWAAQMFLWATSPTPHSYGGGGGRILTSPTFYDVSPRDAEGRRTLRAHIAGRPITMQLRVAKLGPHNLPVVTARDGQAFEVAPPLRGRPAVPEIREISGRLARVAHVRRLANGRLAFFDARRRLIVAAISPAVIRPRLADGVRKVTFATRFAHKFELDGFPVFLDFDEKVIDVEPGQADNGVLMSQSGSLVYYMTSVNDMFAFYRTMLGSEPAIDDKRFPENDAATDQIVAFATAHGKSIPDKIAQIVETKSSWVEADTLPDPQNYILLTATVPIYDKSDPTKWTPVGRKTVKLAMVGLHISGSTHDHPEMIWASFEHYGNAPNAAYNYMSTTGLKPVPLDTSGAWLFTKSGTAGPFNQMHMSWDGRAIVAGEGFVISPSDTLRRKPFGSPANIVDGDVLSINTRVRAMLPAGDVRRNYFLLGTLWSNFGGDPDKDLQVGSTGLANATIETYDQGADSTLQTGQNCFSCHKTNKTEVSHVFAAIKPLF